MTKTNFIFTGNFYSIIPTPKKIVEKIDALSYVEDQYFNWGINCDVQKYRLDSNQFQEIISPYMNSFFEQFKDYFANREVYVHTSDVWKNIYSKGSYQEIHDHLDSELVGVYFLNDLDQESGKTYFYNRNQAEVKKFWLDTFEFQTHYPQVKKGDLLLFPGNMLHGVTQHSSEIKRKTVAFNMELKYL